MSFRQDYSNRDFVLKYSSCWWRTSPSALAWRHNGFSGHNGERVRSSDAEGRKKLAQYMLRAPLSLEKMTCLAETGMVLYRPPRQW